MKGKAKSRSMVP